MQCWLPLCLALAVFPAASVLAADAAGDGKASEEDGGEERSRIFEESVEKLLPVDPGEIRTYIEKRDRVEGAAAPGPARMRTGTRQISAVPGAVPQVIRLTAGYSSTVMFQDATGEPWPVLSIVLGNARAFQATQPKVEAEDGEAQSGARNRTGTARANVASNVVSLVGFRLAPTRSRRCWPRRPLRPCPPIFWNSCTACRRTARGPSVSSLNIRARGRGSTGTGSI